MAQLIEVPGYGQVEFPDNMSDEQIVEAIKNNMSSTNAPVSKENIAQTNTQAAVNEQNQNLSPLQRAGNFAEQNITRPIENFTSAVGQGVTNSGINAINTLSKLAGYPTNIRPFNTVDTNSISGGLGNIAGNTAGFLGAGGIAKGLSSVPAIAETLAQAGNVLSKVPYASKVVNALKNPIGQRAVGAATYGGLQDTNDPAAGAIEGGLTSLGADALLGGAIGKGINALKQPFSAQGKAEEILNNLGEGRSVEENSKAVAQKIKGAYEKAKSEGEQLYQKVFKTTGNEKINENLGPYSSRYETLDKNIFTEDYDNKLKKLHEKYINNPTLENAHNLQSQLGTAIRKLQRKDAKDNLSIFESNVKGNYKDARKNIQADINNYLANKNPELATQYNEATQNWLENVTPYLSKPKISQIAKGRTINPGILKNLFKNPEPEIQKVVSDIGESANKNILYDQLGRINNLTPEKLSNAINNLGGSGLESYITPTIENQFGRLGDTIKNKQLGKLLGGAALGLGAGHLVPFGPIADITGALIGGALGATPLTSNVLRKVLPESKNALNATKTRMSEATKNALNKIAVGAMTQ